MHPADTPISQSVPVDSAAAIHGANVRRGHVSWPAAVARTIHTFRRTIACHQEIRASLDHETSPAARSRHLQAASVAICRTLRVDVTVRGSAPTTPSIIVSNHLSYLDPLLVGRSVPTSAVAKSEIAGWPTIGSSLQSLGIVFVRRGCARSGAAALRKMMRTLADGVSVLVFPEGTTTFGDTVLPFSRGAFGVSRITGVSVVPAAISYDTDEACWVGDAHFLPHIARLHRLERVGATLSFGPALHPNDFEGATGLSNAAREWITSTDRR